MCVSDGEEGGICCGGGGGVSVCGGVCGWDNVVCACSKVNKGRNPQKESQAELREAWKARMVCTGGSAA